MKTFKVSELKRSEVFAWGAHCKTMYIKVLFIFVVNLAFANEVKF